MALISQGFLYKITDKTKIWDKQGKLVIQASALLPTTLLHWFRSKLITPDRAVYSLQESNSYHLWHLCLGHTSKNALCHAHKHLKGVPTLQEPASNGSCKSCQLDKAHERAFSTSSKCSDRILELIHKIFASFQYNLIHMLSG